MTTTKSHHILTAADAVLERAAVLIASKWRRREGVVKPYGIQEALAEAGEGVPRIVAERQCVQYGLDVWWSDLLCIDGEDAAAELRKLQGIDGAELYGAMWEANLGLLVLANGLTPSQLNGLGNVTGGVEWKLFDDLVLMAAAYDRQLLLVRLCEDIHFATVNGVLTPAAVARRLRGIRALECVAAHHVLMDVLTLEQKAILVGPVSKMLLPFGSRG